MRSKSGAVTALVLVILLLGTEAGALVDLPLAGPPVPDLLAPPTPPAALAEADLTSALVRLVAGEATPLDAFAPLIGAPPAAELPAALVAKVRDPPPLDATLRALASSAPLARGLDIESLLRARPLPPEVARAASGLGQAILGARSLLLEGEPATGAALIAHALDVHGGVLQRESIFLEYSKAYSSLSVTTATQATLASLLDARTLDEITRAAGVEGARHAQPDTLERELALLYARLGVPVGREERAAIAAANALDPQLRIPLEQALADVLTAMELREQAFARADAADLRMLQDIDSVLRAAHASDPTPADLRTLVAFGEARERVDDQLLAEGAGFLLGAAETLLDIADGVRVPQPFCCTGDPGPGNAYNGTLALGGVGVRAKPGRDGSLELVVGRDSENTTLAESGFASAAIDPSHGSITLYHDWDLDGSLDPGEAFFSTPPLADPSRDILFQDPYGLVVASGRGTTVTDVAMGNRSLDVRVDAISAPPPPNGATALDTIDRALSSTQTFGVWPFTSEAIRPQLAFVNEQRTPTRLNVTVNPAGYQVLRWDLGGDDAYLTNAAGAGTEGLIRARADGSGRLIDDNAGRAPVPAALLVDQGGNDRYATRVNDTIGAANASLAILIDATGNDTFETQAERAISTATTSGLAIVAHLSGNATWHGLNTTLAYAEGGATALLLTWGDDVYVAENESLAASRLGTLAGLFDLSGRDRYWSRNHTQAASSGGIALLLDARGNDTYLAGPLAQGRAEPFGEGVDAIGPARIALLADLQGSDEGACRAGQARNAMVGTIGLGRAPWGPAYSPAYGTCLDVNARLNATTLLPPTFFTSSFGNTTLPGVLRVGTLENDTNDDPYMLQIDLGGNDTYGAGAVAGANATRLAALGLDLGLVSPISILLDTAGNNTFDGSRPLNWSTAGRFGFADGGIAVHATIADPRPTVDPANATQPTVENATAGTVTSPVPILQQSVNNVRIEHPSPVNTYRNVTTGIAAAQGSGIALLLSRGFQTRVEANTSARCTLACAATQSAAIVVSEGGAGDDINASRNSLGAAYADGGTAIYYRKGGPDTYRGSNESMGLILGEPSSQAAPTLALFLKDGFTRDIYDVNMTFPGLQRTPRGNNAVWTSRTLGSGVNAESPSVALGQGVDNLHWYLNMNAHTGADQGVAPDTGPGNQLGPRTVDVQPPPEFVMLPSVIRSTGNATNGTLYPTCRMATSDNFCRATNQTVNAQFRALANETQGIVGDGSGSSFTTPSAADVSPARTLLPTGAPLTDTGSGNSTTGPYGLRPVTLAMTPFSPSLALTGVRSNSAPVAVVPSEVPYLRDKVEFELEIGDPVAYSEAAAMTAAASATDAVEASSSISRVELSIRGTNATWTGCPVPELADRLDAMACLVAGWDVELGQLNATSTTYPQDDGTWLATLFTTSSYAGGARRIFPSNDYVVTFRAFAARNWQVPAIRDPVLDGALADSWKTTGDPEAFYGSSYSWSVPIRNAPVVDGVNRTLVDSNGHAPVRLAFPVTEPVDWEADFFARNATSGKLDVRLTPLHPGFGGRSRYHDEPQAFAAEGRDWIELNWSAPGNASGMYGFILRARGATTGIDATGLSPSATPIYVDGVAPQYSVIDARATPAQLNAAVAPGGIIPLSLFGDEDDVSDNGAPVDRAHIWLKERLLDPADPSRTLQQGPWTYAGVVRVAPPALVDEIPWGNLTALGDPRPGPPRIYSLAAYAVDRAGNIAVPNPESTPPSGPDCIVRCATFFYDITPPRTRTQLIQPDPALARIARSNVTVLVNASETPDVAASSVLASLVRAADLPNVEAGVLGRDPTPATPQGTINATIGPAYAITPSEPDPVVPRLLLTNGTFSAHLRLDILRNTFYGDPNKENVPWDGPSYNPLHFVLDVTRVGSDASIGPIVKVNVTDALGLKLLEAGTPRVLDIGGFIAPNESGVYRLRVRADRDEMLLSNITEFGAAFLVWNDVPANATGVAKWTPPRELAHGDALFLFTRGIDLAGNVEPKVDYDARIDVDLVAPALAAAPIAHPTANGAAFEISLNEPASLHIEALNATGNVTAVQDTPELSMEHVLALTGLRSGTAYTFRVVATDAVGNTMNVTAFNGTLLRFETPRFLDIAFAPLPSTLRNDARIAWNVTNVTPATVVYRLELSLDDGATWPYDLTGEGLRVLEEGDATHDRAFSPARFPESPSARFRVTAWPADDNATRATATSPRVTLDAKAPTTSIRGQGVGSWARGNATLTLNASDAGSGIRDIEVSRDNLTFTPLLGNLTLNASEPVRIYYRGRDNAENIESTHSTLVQLDANSPDARLTAPRGNVGATAVQVELEASDKLSGVKSIVLRDGQREQNVTPSALVGGRTRLAWPLNGPEGPRTLSLRVTDAAGNVADATLPIRLDRTSPNLTQRTIDRTATELALGLSWSEPANVTATLVGPGGARPIDVPRRASAYSLLQAGDLDPATRYEVRFSARDSAGNLAQITLNATTLPDVLPPGPAHGLTARATREASIFLAWEAAHDDTRIASYRILRAENGSWMPLATTSAGLSWLDQDVRLGQAYDYAVVAIDAGGNLGPASLAARARASLAPVVTDAASALEGTGLRLSARVGDPDGDAPAAHAVIGDWRVSMTCDPSGACAVIIAARVTNLSSATGWHVEASDPEHVTREPRVGEIPLPPKLAQFAAEGGLLAGARLTPAPGAVALSLLVGVAANLMRRRLA